jgi:energy-converting hydrogenase Eha subunit H
MSESLYLSTISVIPITVILVYAMRYFTALRQTNAQLANEKAYRELAEKAVSVQTETRDKLAAVESTLAELRARMSAVETILKTVE